VLKSIAGLMQPDAGSILIDGTPVTKTGRDRGMVFQGYTSFAWRTVRENVEYGLELQGIDKEKRKATALAMIEQVGLKDFADALPKQLSGGMKQRVAIARTLINQPKLVLMDEPFGALDPQTRWGMQTLILDVLRSQDNTVLFVTHDVSEAVYLADDIFILAHRPTQVLHRVKVPYFDSRDVKLKQSNEFKKVENEVLDLLQQSNVQGNIRVGL
jgi:NitT/TauT family transport system ATP-binding protein